MRMVQSLSARIEGTGFKIHCEQLDKIGSGHVREAAVSNGVDGVQLSTSFRLAQL